MNQFFLNKKLVSIVLGAVAIISVLLISLQARGNVVTQGINDVTATINALFASPANSMRDFFDAIKNISDTYDENQALKKQINNVYQLEVQLEELTKQNKALQETLGIQSSLSEYTTIHASVIARNPDSWQDVVVINKGKNDRIEVDMPVMSSNGLIGKVISVSATSSQVALLTNADSSLVRVAAMIQNSAGTIYGTITGYDSTTERLIMTQIQSKTEIKAGDRVVTSGLSGITPSTLLIGTVEEVSTDRYGLYTRVTIVPTASTNDIRYVTVINRLSEGGD